MSFTALHRAETNDLDWKSDLPPAKGLSQTDFPKDVAAMANSAGGLIVYGVRESQKACCGRRASNEQRWLLRGLPG
ncbi:helix-turn-helix domain-containing protein [Aeromicrobium endophyticum]|uniref:AlbA family DNA-binding domain-containing protein n=1 Tax=Aeromicrobium endophyticum TaxID=2292704 RepID=UPI0018F2E7E3